MFGCEAIILKYSFTFQEFNAILDIVENKTGLAFYYNYLLSKQPSEFDNYPKLLQKAEVRKAIHVGNLTYDDISLVVHEYLNDDIPKSIKPWLEELLEHYKVLLNDLCKSNTNYAINYTSFISF